MAKCSRCRDTGGYFAGRRPVKCDCGAYEIEEAKHLERLGLREHELNCADEVLKQLAAEEDYVRYIMGELYSDAMPELKTALTAWFKARKAVKAQ